jgi:hypothetical protein
MGITVITTTATGGGEPLVSERRAFRIGSTGRGERKSARGAAMISPPLADQGGDRSAEPEGNRRGRSVDVQLRQSEAAPPLVLGAGRRYRRLQVSHGVSFGGPLFVTRPSGQDLSTVVPTLANLRTLLENARAPSPFEARSTVNHFSARSACRKFSDGFSYATDPH